MNEMVIFENEKFGTVRTITENGKTLFCGKDIATALGYKRPADAIKAHCKGSVIRRLPTKGGIQDVKFISEGDIYRLAAKSELPGAAEFESWIFDEVLPSIHRHGAYMTPETLEQAILNPDFLMKLAQRLKEEQDLRIKAEAEKAVLEAKVEEDKPKVEFADTVYESNTDITVEKYAKLLCNKHGLSIGRNRLFKLLRAMGYLKENNIPYQKYLDAKYFKTIEVVKYGTPYVVTLITGKGQVKLFEELFREIMSDANVK